LVKRLIIGPGVRAAGRFTMSDPDPRKGKKATAGDGGRFGMDNGPVGLGREASLVW
jgi:hypothetical protein